jgi:hypothetical protein
MLRRCRWSIAGAMAVAMALAGPAQAVPPVKDEQVFTGTVPWTECDGVEIFVEFVDIRMDTFFYDRAGNLVRYVSHSKGQGTLVNPVTGVTNTGAGPSKTTIDLESMTVSIVGQIFHNTEPGEGGWRWRLATSPSNWSRSTPRSGPSRAAILSTSAARTQTSRRSTGARWLTDAERP